MACRLLVMLTCTIFYYIGSLIDGQNQLHICVKPREGRRGGGGQRLFLRVLVFWRPILIIKFYQHICQALSWYLMILKHYVSTGRSVIDNVWLPVWGRNTTGLDLNQWSSCARMVWDEWKFSSGPVYQLQEPWRNMLTLLEKKPQVPLKRVAST